MLLRRLHWRRTVAVDTKSQLATSGGERTQLTNTANQLFIDLVKALREQGLGNKAIADMFGMAHRTYHAKLRRLGKSQTVRGRTSWQAVFEQMQLRGTTATLPSWIRKVQWHGIEAGRTLD